MQEKNIVIYSKRPCPYCEAAKRFFGEKGWLFTEHDLTGRYDEISQLKERTGHMTFPQIYFGDRFIGGFDDMMALYEAGEI